MEEQQIIKALQADMVKSVNPTSTDVIVWTYDKNNLCRKEAYEIFKVIREAFANNKTIGIPDDSSIKICDKAELERIANSIQELLKRQWNKIEQIF